MAGRVVFFVQHGSFEPAFQLASMAITAAAMGEEVIVVLAWDALRQFMRGSFGLPESDRERMEQARSEGLNLPAPAKMLQEARTLGVKVVACESIVRMCGFEPAQTGQVLDEVMGLPSIWRLTQGARTVSL